MQDETNNRRRFSTNSGGHVGRDARARPVSLRASGSDDISIPIATDQTGPPSAIQASLRRTPMEVSMVARSRPISSRRLPQRVLPRRQRGRPWRHSVAIMQWDDKAGKSSTDE